MHFSPDRLTDYALGLLGEEEARDLSEHLTHCRHCDAEMTRLDNAADTVVATLRAGSTAAPYLDELGCGEMLSAIKAIAGEAAPDGSGLLPSDDLPDIREYRLLARIGEGGMGTVYQAVHTRLGKTVAIKLLTPGRVRDAAAVERFQREMLAVGRLDHPNIVQATDAGEHLGAPFLVMEFVDGLDLSRLLKRVGRLKPADACEIIRQAALALQEAHERGLVHRDIKPSNLMLAAPRGPHSSPTVKLLDLGLALLRHDPAEQLRELTRDGQVVGTFDYMAPEQVASSRGVDIRADLYALGMTFRKLLGDDVPRRLAPIMQRLTASRPEDRYAVPRQVADALAPWTADADLAALLDQAQRDTVGKPATLPQARTTRKRWVLLAAGVSALALVAAMLSIPRKSATPGVAPAVVRDLDRQVAEWMLEGGNQVGIDAGSQYFVVTAPEELPEGSFAVRTVQLSKSKPTDEQWAALTQLQDLTTISVFINPNVSKMLPFNDRDVEQIARCRGLTSLSIDSPIPDGGHFISDRGLALISQLDSLRTLVINSRQINDAGLAHLGRLSNLTQLGLRMKPSAEVTTDGMRRLAALPQLSYVTLSSPAITDETLQPLAESPRLASLRLLFTRVSGRGLATFRACPTLQRLELGHARTTEADLEAIATIGQLTIFKLVGEQEIVDQDLLALAPLKNLQQAIFHGCPKLTDAGLESLRRALPGCYVDRTQPASE